ncbi:MAG: BRO family protein [Romboutsia sp.]
MHSIHIRKLNNAGENFLTESGVYKFIFKSRKEEAEKFQDWVTEEVLPAIR